MRKSIMRKTLIFISIIVFSVVSCKNRLLVNPVDPEATNYQGFPYYEEGSVPEGSILPVTGVSPADGSSTTDTIPLLSWDDIKNAPGYQIQFSKTEAGLSQSEPVTLETSEYQITVEDNLELNNAYYWRIRIVNGGNLVSPWSTIFSVTVVVEIDLGYIFVEGGTFQMGSTEGASDEKPVHRVTVGSFYISKYEVTQGEYESLMGSNPSDVDRGIGNNYPVNTVSWYEVLAYANALSNSEGLTPVYTINGTDVSVNWSANGYRLPTEAEWEYAARGGSASQGYTYSGSNIIGDVAWYSDNSGSKTHPVGGKQANELGLYDMSGNVWEWVWDRYGTYPGGSETDPTGASSGSNRVARGGSWFSSASISRSANRDYYNPSYRIIYLGFRLVLH